MVQTKKRYSNLFLNVLVGRVLTPKDVAKAACLAVLPIVWSDDLIGQIGDGHRREAGWSSGLGPSTRMSATGGLE